jgi:putative flippase GtrA
MHKIFTFNSQKIRYLVVGGINTIFGYVIGVAIYKALINQLNIISIGIISNVLCITLSFCTYKIFVFRTKGNWFSEYLKAYIVYGGMAIVGVILLWLFVDIGGLNIWVSQALIILSTVIFSYIGHARFTFKQGC